MNGEQTARQLWTKFECLLPSTYRKVRWEELPTHVQRSMTASVFDIVRERDYELIKHARTKLVDTLIEKTVEGLPSLTLEQLDAVCRIIRTTLVEPPEVK